MKTCNTCHASKDSSAFYKNRAKCKVCVLREQKDFRSDPKYKAIDKARLKLWRDNNRDRYRAYERERSKRNTAKVNAVIKDFFKERSCRVCGYERCFSAIDYHHIDPRTKKFQPKLYIRARCRNGEPSERVMRTFSEELKKCMPLCSNCHREYHAGLINLDKYLSCE